MGQCCCTLCTPVALIGGSIGVCGCAQTQGQKCPCQCWGSESHISRNQTPEQFAAKVFKYQKLESIAGFVSLLIGIALFAYISQHCGGVNLEGGGPCWSEAQGDYMLEGLVAAAGLGIGFPLLLHGVISLALNRCKPPVIVDLRGNFNQGGALLNTNFNGMPVGNGQAVMPAGTIVNVQGQPMMVMSVPQGQPAPSLQQQQQPQQQQMSTGLSTIQEH